MFIQKVLAVFTIFAFMWSASFLFTVEGEVFVNSPVAIARLKRIGEIGNIVSIAGFVLSALYFCL